MYVGPQPMDPVVHIVLEMPGVPRLQATTAFFFFFFTCLYPGMYYKSPETTKTTWVYINGWFHMLASSDQGRLDPVC